MGNAFNQRVLKSRLVNYYEEKGRKDISATDTPKLVLFSDTPLSPKSKKMGKSVHGSWLTSFGEVEARRILSLNTLKRRKN